MMRSIISALLLLVVLSLKAEHIISREKYSIVISSDTVYAGEMYTLYIDLRTIQHPLVKKNGVVVPIDVATNKAYLNFKAVNGNYDWQGNSYQTMNVSIKIEGVVILEKISYVVKRLPMKEHSVQDSVSKVLSNNNGYKKIQSVEADFIYDDFIQYMENNLPLHAYSGQVALALIMNAQGKVIRYDFIKNSYVGISKDAFDKAILSYRVRPDLMGKNSFKFGIEAFTFKGYLGNVFYGHGVLMEEVLVKH